MVIVLGNFQKANDPLPINPKLVPKSRLSNTDAPAEKLALVNSAPPKYAELFMKATERMTKLLTPRKMPPPKPYLLRSLREY